MRRILVESARRRKRLKRGGEFSRIELSDVPIAADHIQEDLIALDAALSKLAITDKMCADLVQMRYFSGLTMSETAAFLEISVRTADRLWNYGRAWLHREILKSGYSSANSGDFVS